VATESNQSETVNYQGRVKCNVTPSFTMVTFITSHWPYLSLCSS